MVTSIATRPSKSVQRRYRPYAFDLASLILIGIILASFSASLEHKIFLLVLIGSGSLTYLSLLQSSQATTKLHRHFNRLVFAPSFATLFGVAILALFNLYFSALWAFIFCATWTLCIVSIRFIFLQLQPQLRLATIGSATMIAPTERHPAVSIDVLLSPPNMFHAWDAVIIDPKQNYNTDWLTWLAHANMMGIPTISKPAALEEMTGMLSTTDLRRIWMGEVLSHTHSYEPLKWAFDVIATLLLLPLLIPLATLVALLVYFDGGGPVIFCQKRVGRHGRTFTMFKFRSMRKDAEREGAQFAGQHDCRVTKLGQLLRKYRLDELPQFWNVLKGDMSIIGPRPEQKVFVEDFNESIHLYDLRHRVRPGITGWAQVNQGYAAGEDETNTKLCYDLYYVKNNSLTLDIRIVLRTVQTILTGFGAR